MNSQNIQEDIRSIRTKKNLYEAFFRLLEHHPFKSIAVHDICAEAMVHRTTLYKHFKNKCDLLEYGAQQIFLEMMQKVQHFPPQERPLRSCDLMIDFVDSHRAIILHTVQESLTPTLWLIQDRLSTLLTQHHSRQWEELGYPILSSPVSHQIMGRFLSGGITAFILWWVKQENPLDKETVKTYLHEIILTKQPH